MKDLLLEIPAEIVAATRLPQAEIEDEFRKELALALYQRGLLSSGKASSFAKMTRWEFETLLGQRQITRHYSESDLEDDIAYASGDQ
jgi:predicted HTH domain antitoxin